MLGNAFGKQVPGRIFLIGYNKCGTRSFYKLLRKNGYSSIHYDKGRLARRIKANFTFSKPLLDGVDGCFASWTLSSAVSCTPTGFSLCWICSTQALASSTKRVT